MARISFLCSILYFMLLSGQALAKDTVCDDWFAKSKLKSGLGCLVSCTSLPTDLNTFYCHDSCPIYCKSSTSTDFIFKLTDLYPGLTKSERALAAQYPIEALKGYKDALAAENICAEKFGGSRTNDESDACRHFIWAGLMFQDIGQDLALKFLNAHENYSGNPQDEKNMDLENNSIGLVEAANLSKTGEFSQEDLVNRFDFDLSKGKLKVLKPRIKPKGNK